MFLVLSVLSTFFIFIHASIICLLILIDATGSSDAPISIKVSISLFIFNLIMAVIGSFQVFTQAFVMTGGEPGDLTRFYVLYLFNKAFELYDMGYASAMAWILLVIVLVLTGVILRTSARVVYYESLKK